MEEYTDFDGKFADIFRSLATNLSEDETAVVEESGYDEEISKISGATTTSINLFQHPDTHPLVLDLALLRKYGPEWFVWEPEVLLWRIPQDFKTQSVSELNVHKVQAVKTLHVVDTFWKRWEVFNWCFLPLNSAFPDFHVVQVPTVAQCLVAVDVANKVRTDVPWSDELKAYLTVIYKHDGLIHPLPPTDFVELDFGLPNEAKEIAERWPAVRRANTAPTGDSIVDEQLRRMLIATGYLEEHRARLRTQLNLVPNA